jgi:signal peptidase I
MLGHIKLIHKMFKRKKQNYLPFGDHCPDDDCNVAIYRPNAAAHSHLWAEARLLLRDIIFAVLLAVLLMVFIVQPVKVEGSSMLPRLHDGERIFVNKLIYYGVPKLERGDIVVFWYPNNPEDSYIKRVIGLPGETIEVRAGRIYINGAQLEEPYLDPQRNQRRDINLYPTVIKPHYFFVMGDNRDRSSDSREWGVVPEKYIYGKALFRFMPLSEAGTISDEDAEPRLIRPAQPDEINLGNAGDGTGRDSTH